MNLFFRKHGSGDALVILHGLFGSSMNWNSIGKKLSKKYSVYLVDQRNHGKSFHSNEFNYGVLSNDLNVFLIKNQIDQVHLLGHSMGGKTALQYAFDYPEKVKSLVVVDIGLKKFRFQDFDLLQAMNGLDLNTVRSRKEIDKLLADHIPVFGLRQFIMQNIQRSKEGSFEWRMNLPILSEKIKEVGEQIKSKNIFIQPTLFVRGSKSDYILDEDMVEIKKYFKNVRFETIKDAGHWVHFDNPNDFLSLVEEFL